MDELNDHAAGLTAIWLTPAAEGQEPVVSLDLVGRQKRYARLWLNRLDRVEWGWVLPRVATCVWEAAEPARKYAIDRLIGRERPLINGLTAVLHEGLPTRHNYSTIRETHRGSAFEVELCDPDGTRNGYIARVSVEIVDQLAVTPEGA